MKKLPKIVRVDECDFADAQALAAAFVASQTADTADHAEWERRHQAFERKLTTLAWAFYRRLGGDDRFFSDADRAALEQQRAARALLCDGCFGTGGVTLCHVLIVGKPAALRYCTACQETISTRMLSGGEPHSVMPDVEGYPTEWCGGEAAVA